MTVSQLSSLQRSYHALWQRQQPHVIRDLLPRYASVLANVFLGQLEILAQVGEGLGLLHAIQVLALEVFYQRHLRRLLLRDPLHDCGSVWLPRQPRSPQAPLAQNKDEPPLPPGTHHDWLDHSLHGNRIRQFLERGLIEVSARLVGIVIDLINRYSIHRFPIGGNSGSLGLEIDSLAHRSGIHRRNWFL